MKLKNFLLANFEQLELFRRRFGSPESHIKRIFKARMGYELDLENPQTFNEKLCWLKLYDQNPIYTKLVDKFEVKKYIADKIGEEYIIPTIAVYNKAKDIEWDNLPQSFVLKCTHDSGGLIICKNKNELDIPNATKKLTKFLKRNYYYAGFEYPYKNVTPRIIAEKYMEDDTTKELRDYKFFCFNGEIKALFIATERGKGNDFVKFDFFDSNFQHLPFRKAHQNSLILPTKPICFEEMKRLASILSQDLIHVRIDFYEVNGRIYFGEMTFYHDGGWVRFDPMEWDYIFGNWIKLPNNTR